MARKTKEEKRIEAEVDAAFRKACAEIGGKIDVFDIGRIMAAGEMAATVGRNIEEAVFQCYKENVIA